MLHRTIPDTASRPRRLGQRTHAFAAGRRGAVITLPADPRPLRFRRSARESGFTLPDEALMHGQLLAGAVNRSEQKSCKEGEMVDEEAELGLVSLPMRRAMKGEG